MKLAIYTLGCKLNQCESEALASAFRDQGFSVLDSTEEADLYIVNTCTVTSKAEQKARRMIRKFSRQWPDAAVLITGCYAQLEKDELLALGPRVRLVSQDHKDRLLSLPVFLREEGVKGVPLLAELDRFLSYSQGEPDPFAFRVDAFQFHSRAYLKFQDGCNNRCAYCRTTLARGASVSLPWPEMKARLLELEAHGYREIVLTGINITSYSWEGVDFPSLLEKVSHTMTTARIRLSSLEPETITEELGRVLASDIFCPHFHIPVQSGSDSVLKRMRRKNNADKIRSAVSILRRVKDDPFIAADVIAGFPGETDQEFQDTYDLLRELDFTQLHVFPFSPRPGTEAEKMNHPVPERISRERTAALRELSEGQHRQYLLRQAGREFSFLLEQPVSEDGSFWWATSENYLKCQIDLSSISCVSSRGTLMKGLLSITDEGSLKVTL